MGNRSAAVAVIARAIRDYLTQNPHAVDTADGVREWWLGDLGAAPGEDEVETALQELVAQGAIVETMLPDGRRVYASLAARRR